MLNPVYQRILLKMSGEVLAGDQAFGISPEECKSLVNKVKPLVDSGVQLGIVIGGGNIFRGAALVQDGLERVNADYIGMMATLMNAITLNSYFNKSGLKSHVLSSLSVHQVSEIFNAQNAKKYLDNGEIVIFAGGTGNPYFTTDTAAALRALEIEADILLKATKVDGIYTADPEKDPNAEKFDSITFDIALEKNLNVMDMTAFALCRDNDLPVYVFNIKTENSLSEIAEGHNIGSLIKKDFSNG
tara:strand:+ start:596 stop:1327 length:732 start_codon:yes stop_codon:yes gene_type:complete